MVNEDVSKEDLNCAYNKDWRLSDRDMMKLIEEPSNNFPKDTTYQFRVQKGSNLSYYEY